MSTAIESEVNQTTAPQVALFVTCLADLFRPATAEASLRLLQDAGCDVIVPKEQTCCGQPQYNSGDRDGARALARNLIRSLTPYEYVVVPSGSCAGMLIKHYPNLFDGAWKARADALAERVYELTQFLADVCQFQPSEVSANPSYVYHDACAGLRELGIKAQPRKLLQQAGNTVVEISDGEVCCGFGGTFCAKMPDVSAKMADDKLSQIEESGQHTVLAGDLGCLLALAGRAQRRGLKIDFKHVAEALDPQSKAAPIGTPSGR